MLHITGTGPYTITLAGLGFATATDPTAAAFAGAQTIYPAGDLTLAVQAALLVEGGVFDQLTPGDVFSVLTGPVLRPRFPPISPDYPTDLLKAAISSDVFRTFGVADVHVIEPADSTVSPDAGYLVTPLRFLIRPI